MMKMSASFSPVASRNGSQRMPGHPPKYGLVVPHSSLHLTISILAFEMSFMISMLIGVGGERAKTVDIDRVVEYFWKSFDVQRR